jgi:hypothetical protein
MKPSLPNYLRFRFHNTPNFLHLLKWEAEELHHYSQLTADSFLLRILLEKQMVRLE